MAEKGSTSCWKTNVAFFAAGAAAVVAGEYVRSKLIANDTKVESVVESEVASIDVTDDERELMAEQLSRNVGFFGRAGQQSVENAFVVVIGVGGVGYWGLGRSGHRDNGGV